MWMASEVCSYVHTTAPRSACFVSAVSDMESLTAATVCDVLRIQESFDAKRYALCILYGQST